jgi:hypothetical protein
MWVPTPLYERLPQFWFLLGLLFIANGLYLGLDFVLAFAYLAVGLSCCTYGMGIALARLAHRTQAKTVEWKVDLDAPDPS